VSIGIICVKREYLSSKGRSIISWLYCMLWINWSYLKRFVSAVLRGWLRNTLCCV